VHDADRTECVFLICDGGDEMIPGPCDPHWLTLFDDDGEPFGETCCCEIDADHYVSGRLTDPEDDE
jgi:hypothetical protein